MKINPKKSLKGEITPPSDKSISHRGVMLGAVSEGRTVIKNILLSDDVRSTISCFKQMGVDILIDEEKSMVTVYGAGLYGLKAPKDPLYAGNSGTTTRLLSGILTGQSFPSEIFGDSSLNTRPMKRIIDPLTMMGADIVSKNNNGTCPLVISPSSLHGIDFLSPLASAQVKSCILLSGLYADSPTSVTEPSISRDHTERMLPAFGADIKINGNKVTVFPQRSLHGIEMTVPSDISSAAYFIAAALITKDSEILIRNVGINPTRAGIIDVARRMGGNITLLNEREISGEPIADILAKSSELNGTLVGGDEIPTLIDEIPVIAILAAHADGQTVIKNASDLKAKETDRIFTVSENLKKMGALVTPTDDGMIIDGTKSLSGAVIDSYNDHRIAMAFSIAALNAKGTTEILRSSCASVSYPGFYEDLESLQK